MVDVARAAGVSHMTVSRVLSGTTRVSPHTRARVEEAVRALGYRPNLAARALVTRRSGQLRVMFFDTAAFGPVSVLFAIEQAARRERYSVSILSLPRISAGLMRDALAHLRTVDGTIIVAPPTTAAAGLREAFADRPAVVVGGAGVAGLPFVAIDQEAGARRATEHLLSLGHPAVWHIAGPSTWADARARARGWRTALQRARTDVPPRLSGDWSARSGFEAGRRLAQDLSVSAIFAANDHMALGALRAFDLAGRRVPRDVSVVGFDNVPESPYYPSALTTIRQDFNTLGEMAISTLLARLDGVESERRQLLEPELIIRSSTTGRS